MKGMMFWALVSLALGAWAAVRWRPAVTAHLGWPDWLVSGVVCVDVVLVLALPLTLQEYARARRRARIRRRWGQPGSLSVLRWALLTLILIVGPVLGLLWLLARG